MSEFERRKELIIRSLFYDSPDLSTIQEDSDEFVTARSPDFSPEPYHTDSPCPPPAHRNGPWSPLPPLTIEIVKEPNKHDEPEEYYKRLHKKILKIYKRIFFEDRSDISDIITSDDDDTPTLDEPIDYSTSRVELVESSFQSVNDKAENQGNHENVTTAGYERQQSNEDMELQVNETSDDESRNERHDDKGKSDDDDLNEHNEGDLQNLEPEDGYILNLEANIENDDECVTSSTDVMANSTESDGNHDSVTPLSSTVVLSRGTSDEELVLERDEGPPNISHHIGTEAEEMDSLKTSGPQTAAGSIPRIEAILNEGNANIEAMEADPDKNNVQSEIEEMRTPRPNRSTVSPILRHDNVHPNEPNIVITEHCASMESDTNDVEISTRPNNTIENPDSLDLFDLIRLSSPNEATADKRRITDPYEFTENLSSEENSNNFSPEDNLKDPSPEYNLRTISPNENNRKRQSISPYRGSCKKVKRADKSVQTDHILTRILQNIDININSVDRNEEIDNLYETKVVQNIKININTL